MESALIFLTVVILVVIGLLGFVTARRRPSQEAEDLRALREALREVSLEEEALPQDPEEEELLEEEEVLLEKEEIPEEEEEEEEADAGVEVPLEP
ncbi:MAG: hypothetical protein ACRDJK_10705, partial [Actinomycetota bacterium]